MRKMLASFVALGFLGMGVICAPAQQDTPKQEKTKKKSSKKTEQQKKKKAEQQKAR